MREELSELRRGNLLPSGSAVMGNWQMYGRSVKRRAPSVFINLLKRKAKRAGGELRHLPTEKFKMPQYDHSTGNVHKETTFLPLACTGRRERYSAAGHIQINTIQSIIAKMWAAQEPVLRRTGWRCNQPTNGNASAEPTVIPSSGSSAIARML